MESLKLKFRAIDSHAHLEELRSLEEGLKKAFSRGILAIVTAGSNIESSLFALEAGRRFSNFGLKIFGAIGIHPWSLREMDGAMLREALRFIEAKASEAVAIGEVGLDFWLSEGRRLQREVFKKLLKIAREADKPVVVHGRGAWEECLRMVEEVGVKALFHWFSGPLEVLKEVLAQGHYISATPALDYSRDHRAVVINTPLSRLVSETDSPVHYKGRFNREAEPSDVIEVVEMLASLKRVDVEKAAESCLFNAVELYRLNIDGLELC